MAAGPPSADPLHWSLVVPWVLSIASIIFSIFNLIYTTKVAKKIRRDGIAREEFNTAIRRPIEAGLSEMTAEVAKLRALGRGFNALSDMRKEVTKQAAAIVEKSEKLFEALASADRVEWITGTDWAALAEGPWDTFLENTSEAENADSREQLVACVEAAAAAIQSLSQVLRVRIEQEIQRHIQKQ